MSMNRDNFRSNQPPSKVLHVRNLPNDATEDEVQQLCRSFGRVVRIKMSGKERTQAFVEFENMNQAMNMVSFFVGNSNPPKIRNKAPYLQYSTRTEIGGGGGAGGGGGGGGGGGSGGSGDGAVVLVIMDDINIPLGPPLESLHALFTTFGSVHKIMMFEKPNNSLQALIQMSAAKESNEAKATLDGRVLPSYLAPNHPGEIRMKVSFSAHTDLNVRFNSERSRDFVNPMLPYLSGHGLGGSSTEQTMSNVLLIMIDDVAYPITVDALNTICSTYGFVRKMTIFEKAGNWQALVQYNDMQTAASAKQCLEGHCMYEGGYNKLKCSFSMHNDLVVRTNDDRNRDFTVHSAPAPMAPPSEPAAGPIPWVSGKEAAVAAAASTAGRPPQYMKGTDWEAAHDQAAKSLARHAASTYASASTGGSYSQAPRPMTVMHGGPPVGGPPMGGPPMGGVQPRPMMGMHPPYGGGGMYGGGY